MQKKTGLAKVILAVILLGAVFGSTGYPQTPVNELEKFSWLIGGKWSMDKTGFHKFEWGFQKKSVISRTYAKVGSDYKVVSEGRWFYHPGQKVIKGHFSAQNMPFEFLEFTTRFEGSTMVNDLSAYDKNGKLNEYTSTWEPTENQDGYLWRLFMGRGDSKKEIMKGSYKKE